ncbi:hypothetical protein DUNSADRAFT_5766 [Dunaliella salina]|uniref:Uncharacterized protein n=1 Tax=Dunaliella salina TaxID=3046 RepID=A0ABQ7H760_DUNSA|nr:hypothetical protein DUNSADRAFT_5766 [Dunaliella salina]|eukprot:KAF5842690.1 hypothetical protein DUNSADRAFT_5766 [Dunaliella salina]
MNPACVAACVQQFLCTGEATAKKHEVDQSRKAETQGMSKVLQRKKRKANVPGEGQ